MVNDSVRLISRMAALRLGASRGVRVILHVDILHARLMGRLDERVANFGLEVVDPFPKWSDRRNREGTAGLTVAALGREKKTGGGMSPASSGLSPP
jgi:hypothetical protein